MKHWQNLSLENIEGEIWKPVIGYEGFYEVSNKGRIKRIADIIHIMKQRIQRGYCNTCLCKNNTPKLYRVHRLEAFAFCQPLTESPT